MTDNNNKSKVGVKRGPYRKRPSLSKVIQVIKGENLTGYVEQGDSGKPLGFVAPQFTRCDIQFLLKLKSLSIFGNSGLDHPEEQEFFNKIDMLINNILLNKEVL